MAREDPQAGLSSLHVRGRGGPEFHDTKDAGRPLLVRDQVCGTRDYEQRLEEGLARHGTTVRDVQRPGSHTRSVREREGVSTPLAEISTATQQTPADDILEQEVDTHLSLALYSIASQRHRRR